ncbi:hypothetical protein HPQ64_17210 [Rhizobiales bacterium]|uniref:hypothetical protein n=1 Tax=Hongsoonwoonella zoysiae TaxID=2821844 RepID=UPI00155F6FD8|nr:hypothetical protein [Hongsoonwoonella zoysiae]NRG19434.1 hypothetical protein [Hongsoonwoonella zoysiae]
MFRVIAAASALSLALATAGCNSTAPTTVGGVLDYVLFAPTYDANYVPETYGTPYECKTAAAAYGGANVWRGNIGGRKFDFDRSRPVGREGCFRTRAECEAFLTLMAGYIDQVMGRSCVRGYG